VKILFLTPYPLDEAPSQRFRFELFTKSIEEKGWEVRRRTFLSISSWKNLYNGSSFIRIRSTVQGFTRRILHLVAAFNSDIVFIHRELTPFGPPLFEWLVAKVFRKKIIYDYDDAIWLPDPNEVSKIWQWLKWKSKVKWICRWSYKVSVGNEYLAAFARHHNGNVVTIPTVVNTEIHRPTTSTRDPKVPFTIGWTGSHSTLQYLKPLIPVLQKLEQELEVTLLVIANQDPKLNLKNYQFIHWSKEFEVEDLQKIDIGIMPLSDDQWSKGKCGFKAIQYGAVGIPSVVSPVGVNTQVVLDGKTGYLCQTHEEWEEKLRELITNPELRHTMGHAARKHIKSHYSVEAVEANFMGLFC